MCDAWAMLISAFIYIAIQKSKHIIHLKWMLCNMMNSTK